MVDLSGKTCIVTGGNSGIGRETIRGLAEAGARVILVSRTAERGQAALEELRAETKSDKIELALADFAELSSVRALAADLLARCPEVHILVNNAGLWLTERTETVDGLETTFQVNHLAPFQLTNLLLNRIKASAPARIVNVSSKGHLGGKVDFEDLQAERSYGKITAYCNSKLMNVLFTRELARRLEGTEVTANVLHPGTVNTGLGSRSGILGWLMKASRPFLMTPEKGARTSLHLALSEELSGVSGEYFENCKIAKGAKASWDLEAARRLWEVSSELAGLA